MPNDGRCLDALGGGFVGVGRRFVDGQEQTVFASLQLSSDLVETMRNLLACLTLLAGFHASCVAQFNFGADVDGNGCVQISDLLQVMTNFGQCVPDDLCESPYHEGYIYDVVQIGEQCWYAENVRYLPFVNQCADTSSIEPRITISSSTTDQQLAQQQVWYQLNGALYNYACVQDLNLCPTGWKVPNEDDFIDLWSHIGFSPDSGETIVTGLPGDGNWTGFSARLCGYKPASNNCVSHGNEKTRFWTSDTVSFGVPGGKHLSLDEQISSVQIGISSSPFAYGMSVRCIKDDE